MPGSNRLFWTAATRLATTITVCLAWGYTAPPRALGQDGGGDEARTLPGLKSVMAVRATGERVQLDGSLDDAAWASALFFSDFLQRVTLSSPEGPGKGMRAHSCPSISFSSAIFGIVSFLSSHLNIR